jgi:hypothetical protein
MKKILILLLLAACSSSGLHESSKVAGYVALTKPVQITGEKTRDQFTFTAHLTSCDYSPFTKYIVIYGPKPSEKFFVRYEFGKKDYLKVIQPADRGDYRAVLMDSKSDKVLQEILFSTKSDDRPNLYFSTCGKSASTR